MEVKIYIPHLSLQPFVLNISTIHVLLPEGISEVVTPYPPTPFQSLIFYGDNPISMAKAGKTDFVIQPSTGLVGPQFSRVNIKVHSQLSAIRVDFVPGGMYRMFHLPMQELFDEGFDAEVLLGNEIRDSRQELVNANSLAEGKEIVERFLMNQLQKISSVLPFDNALKTLFDQHGNLSIEKTASLSCLSIKQFERICKERIGMNPKTYARILKFSRAYRLRESFPDRSWADICYEAGYYDQMHMIRDFKLFAGVNPSIIAEELLHTSIKMQKDLPH